MSPRPRRAPRRSERDVARELEGATDHDILVRVATIVIPLVDDVREQADRIDQLESLADRARGYVAGVAAAAGVLSSGLTVGALRLFGH